MATIGSFKKVGNDFQGEIVTLSVQGEAVHLPNISAPTTMLRTQTRTRRSAGMVVMKCSEESAAYRIGPTSPRETTELAIEATAKRTCCSGRGCERNRRPVQARSGLHGRFCRGGNRRSYGNVNQPSG